MSERLVACPCCTVHVHRLETHCPFCGFRARRTPGNVGRVAGAALLGLTLASCQIEPEYGVPNTETEGETETEATTGTSTGTTGSVTGNRTGDEVPCEMLDPDSCSTRVDCISSEVRVFRLDEDGACELLEEAPECLERTLVTDGCAGWCGPDPAPWYEERADSGTAIADVEGCGDAIADWSECSITDEGIIPEVCACACAS